MTANKGENHATANQPHHLFGGKRRQCQRPGHWRRRRSSGHHRPPQLQRVG